MGRQVWGLTGQTLQPCTANLKGGASTRITYVPEILPFPITAPIAVSRSRTYGDAPLQLQSDCHCNNQPLEEELSVADHSLQVTQGLT